MMHTDVNVDFPGLRGMRMPLYFILSGLFFKDYGGFLNLLVKKANKILIPFLFSIWPVIAFLFDRLAISRYY